MVMLLFFIFLGFFNKDQKIDQKIEEKNIENIKIVKINNVVLNIEVADTDEERTQGLSGREKLEEGTGMLFVFEKEGYYGIWMKDMKFSIDIIWLDKNKKIVQIEKNVSPETYPRVFQPFNLNLYVLEVSVGFLSKNNIKIGDFVAF